jgi:hypothetical protein
MKAPQTAALARIVLIMAGLVLASLLLLVGCRGEGTGATPARAVSSTDSVFDRVLSNPAATVTGGQLYVAWQVNPASAPVPRFELARVDQAIGAIEAAHLLGAGYLGWPPVAGCG